MVVQNVESGLLLVLIAMTIYVLIRNLWFTQIGHRDKHIRTHHKELSKEQKSELKCKIPRTIVHDYLDYIDNFDTLF